MNDLLRLASCLSMSEVFSLMIAFASSRIALLLTFLESFLSMNIASSMNFPPHFTTTVSLQIPLIIFIAPSVFDFKGILHRLQKIIHL